MNVLRGYSLRAGLITSLLLSSFMVQAAGGGRARVRPLSPLADFSLERGKVSLTSQAGGDSSQEEGMSLKLEKKTAESSPPLADKELPSLDSVESSPLCRHRYSKQVVKEIPGYSVMFKSDGSKQCEEGKQPLSAMEKKLKNQGIKILKSVHGYLITHRGPSSCGEDTGNIHIFYVPSSQEFLLIKKGFKNCMNK